MYRVTTETNTDIAVVFSEDPAEGECVHSRIVRYLTYYKSTDITLVTLSFKCTLYTVLVAQFYCSCLATFYLIGSKPRISNA